MTFPRSATMRGMKFRPSFSLRTLLIVTSIAGVVMAWSLSWPVTDATSRGRLRRIDQVDVAVPHWGEFEFHQAQIQRPPTNSEIAIRIVCGMAALALAFVLLVAAVKLFRHLQLGKLKQ
jgi:hypothetical protein